MLWDFYSATPTLHPPVSVEQADAFRFPFGVANDSRFFTLFNVHPNCGFEGVPQSPVRDLMIDKEADVGMLAPGSTPAQFRCSVEGFPAIGGVSLYVTVNFDVRLFFCWYFHRTKEVHYWLMVSAKGDAYWIEGDELRSPHN